MKVDHPKFLFCINIMVNDIAQKQRTINNCLHTFSFTTSTLDNTDVAIKNGQSRKTGNIEYTGR